MPDGWDLDGYMRAVEWRFARGAWDAPGPAAVWTRIRVPLVAGEPLSPLQRVVAVADSGNGVSRELELADWWFINVELTVHLLRPPRGEWICLDAATTIHAGGAATAMSVLSDDDGPVARGAQTLLVAPAVSVVALVGGVVCTGEEVLRDRAVVVADGCIEDIVSAEAVPAGARVVRVEGFVAPGLVDLQVNGGGDVLLNDALTVDGVRAIVACSSAVGDRGGDADAGQCFEGLHRGGGGCRPRGARGRRGGPCRAARRGAVHQSRAPGRA